MKKETLYLHVGWSKTGTSAIQAQVQAQKDDFLDKGILYPQALQWPDHSHHPFALAFQGKSGTYHSEMTAAQALDKLRLEMAESRASDVLISSELSPFYLDNSRFNEFVHQHFSDVKVVFTIRPQSDLLLSLFNQLVKDPNVRYSSSLFTLAMRNIGWLNFYQNIKKWAGAVGPDNVIVISYSDAIVEDFFHEFSIPVEYKGDDESRVVNPSLPIRCLAVLQLRGRKAGDNASFVRIRDDVIALADNIPKDRDRYVLFPVAEQRALDDHFKQGTQLLAQEYGLEIASLQKKNYKPVNVLPPSINLDQFAGRVV